MEKGFLGLFIILLFNACSFGNSGQPESLAAYIEERAKPLLNSADLDKIIEAAGSRKLALLGEASHGTHEYYAWRDSISRRLIAEKGFNFIAVEGDWASLYELNRYVKNLPGAAPNARLVLEGLDRWPLWMWGNEEVLALAEWLREFNDAQPADKKVGFYGMDVYDEWRSKRVLLDWLKQNDPELHAIVYEHYSCFSPFDGDSWAYAQSLQRGFPSCEDDFLSVVQLIENKCIDKADIPRHECFYLLQNALVLKYAEKFFRKSVSARDASAWNSRVNYMNLTVNRLLELYGPDAKGIVWAHNTHVGDARFTEMVNFGQENIGHLSRVHHGQENVFIVGFSTFKGTVKAGSGWESEMKIMNVPAARTKSIEKEFYRTGLEQFLLVFNDEDRKHKRFIEPMGNRAIGVVYNPARDHQQNYVLSIVPLRYDAMIFFRETRALSPLKR